MDTAEQGRSIVQEIEYALLLSSASSDKSQNSDNADDMLETRDTMLRFCRQLDTPVARQFGAWLEATYDSHGERVE